jgi:hypothetical protein
MNIFALSDDAVEAARSMCDKHVVKMVTESAQMLSTAHRLLDGIEYKKPSKSGKRMIKAWKLTDHREHSLMASVHMHHPCTVWTCETSGNYVWHYLHYVALSEEYTYRYGKTHGAFTNNNIGSVLANLPKNIKPGSRGKFPIAMSAYPECIIEEDPINSYRNYYNVAKKSFAVWTKREVPEWFHV